MIAGAVPEGSLIWEFVALGLAVLLVTAMLAAIVVVAIRRKMRR
jgi:hypothetical protein